MRYILAGLIFLLFAVTGVFAEDFAGRPTASELDEIVAQLAVSGHAVRNRSLAVKGDQTYLPYQGSLYQFVGTLQQALENLVGTGNYVNNIGGPLNTNKTSFLFFSLATWRSAAELNASGFGRYDAEGNLVGYGVAQSNDTVRMPVVEELQAGYRALCWTVATEKFDYERQTGVSYSKKDDWTESTMEAERNYGTNGGGCALLGEIEATYASTWDTGNKYRTTVRRTVSGILTLDGFSSNVINCLNGVFIYLRAKNYAGGEIGTNNCVFDNNGLSGLTDDYKFDEIYSHSSSFTVGQELQFIDNTNVPTMCVDPKNNSPQGAFRGFYAPEDPCALLKWNFAD